LLCHGQFWLRANESTTWFSLPYRAM
jgi:hypothetical protein